MSQVLTSIGLKYSIYVGASTVEPWKTADQKPYGDDEDDISSAFVHIPGIIDASEIDLDPDTIDTTSYDQLRYRTSVPGLIDTSGIQSLTINVTAERKAETIWNAALAALGSTTQCWLCCHIKGLDDEATYIPINPIKYTPPTAPLNDRVTRRLKYTITGDIQFGAAPTTPTSAG